MHHILGQIVDRENPQEFIGLLTEGLDHHHLPQQAVADMSDNELTLFLSPLVLHLCQEQS